MYAYIHTYTYTHTYIHTYIHTGGDKESILEVRAAARRIGVSAGQLDTPSTHADSIGVSAVIHKGQLDSIGVSARSI